MKRLLLAAAIAAASVLATTTSVATAESTPTCSDTLGIAVHGQHIVGDYVTGIGHENLDWPPAGEVGGNTSDGGAAIPGGPGPRFHFTDAVGAPPGASFCTDGAQSINAVENQQATQHVPDVR